MKFFTRTFDGHEVRLFHDANNLRVYPIISWIPYFWDSDIALDMAIKIPRFGKYGDSWNYHWELRDLDNKMIYQGNFPKEGDDIVTVTNKGFRRKLVYWNSGKKRAIVLGNVHPHREYMLYIKFKTATIESDNMLMACFSVDDRDTWQMQAFLGMFLVIFTIFMTIFFKGCEL